MNEVTKHILLVLVFYLECFPRCWHVTATESTPCWLSQNVPSSEEKVFRAMTAGQCEASDKDIFEAVTCAHPDHGDLAWKKSCFCSNTLHRLGITCSDKNLQRCCSNSTCLNGGHVVDCNPFPHCQCPPNFSGKRCENKTVYRRCHNWALYPQDMYRNCDLASDNNELCVHNVHGVLYLCYHPVGEKNTDNGLPECSEILKTTPNPVDPWSPWCNWSRCHMTDDKGNDKPCWCRKRNCRLGDGNCTGKDMEITNCTEHGHWTEWTHWTSCSATCGKEASRSRYRFCSNPSPKFGGRGCDGENSGSLNETQIENCHHNQDCPVSSDKLRMTDFSSWASMTFGDSIAGNLKVRSRLVCESENSLEELEGHEIAKVCYLLKVNVEHCHEGGCTQIKGLRKLMDKSLARNNPSKHSP